MIMVLISFSIPEHIALIKSGKKSQTTRIPRKQKSAFVIGSQVHLYYRSRIKASCDNCLEKRAIRDCITGFMCDAHTNFFGKTWIKEIIHYHNSNYKENGNEVWIGHTLRDADAGDKETWAHTDGFDSYRLADEYFSISTKDPQWDLRDLDVIIWDAEPIIKRWQ